MGWAFLCVLAALLPFLTRDRTAPFDFLEPIYPLCLYAILLFGYRGIYLLGAGWQFDLPFATSALIVKALILASVGILALQIGYYSGVGERLARQVPLAELLGAGERGYPAIAILVCAAVGVAGIALQAKLRAGSTEADVASMAGTYWAVPAIMPLPLAFIMIVINGEGKRWTASRAMASGSLLVAILGSFAIYQSKAWLLRPFFYLLVAYHYRQKKLTGWKAPAICLLGTLAFCVTNLFKLYYHGFRGNLLSTVSFLESVAGPWRMADLLFSRFYGTDDIAVVLQHVANTHRFWMGSSLAEMLYWFVPRAAWPNKPYTFGIGFAHLFARYTGHENTAFVSLSLFGESYLNFGIVGVVVVGVGFGIVSRAVYVYLVHRAGTKSAIILYAIALLHLMYFLQGSFAGHVGMMAVEVTPMLAMMILTHESEFFKRAAVRRYRMVGA